MKAALDSLLDRYAAGIRRYPLSIFVAACGLTAAAAGYASRLELRSSFEELLPESYRSVQDLHRVVGRVGGLGNLAIAVECDDLQASERFAEDLVPRLRQNLPPRFVRYVEYNVSEQKGFYERNKYLYADLADLEDVRQRAKDRIAEEKWKASPLAVELDLEEEGAQPQTQDKGFDLSDIEERYRKRIAKLDRYTDGYFVGEEGRLLAILVKPYGTAGGIDFARELVAAVQGEIAALDPASYHPSMKVGLTGKYRTNIDQNQAIIDDIVSTTAFTVILVFLSVYAFYRTMGAFLGLGLAVAMGVAWTFALTALRIGYLNSQTAFLGSIIVGNGINYGIIFMARYQEERRHGVETGAALAASIRNTILATATAALATAIAFGTLMATEFKGFNQFGFIGGFGMLFCWVACFTVLPAWVVLYERAFLRRRGWAGGRSRRPWLIAAAGWAVCHWVLHLEYLPATGVAAGVLPIVWVVERLAKKRLQRRGGQRIQWFVGPAAHLVEHHPRVVVGLSILLVVASAAMVIRFIPDAFEYDFSKLLHKSRQRTEAEQLSKRVNAIFGQSLTPVLIMADRLDQVEDIQRQIIRRRDAEPKEDRIIDTCRTLLDYLPKQQEQKLAVLREIHDLIDDELLGYIQKPEQRQDLMRIRDELSPLKQIDLDDLPPMMTRNYEELDGVKGLIVYVYPMPGAGLWDGRRLIRFAESVRATPLPSGETIYTSGEAVVYADLLKAVKHDAPRAAVVSTLGVFVLLLVSFRNLRGSMTVITSLLCGLLIMGGGMALFDVKLNFFNFVVIPITLGIGVDYAVNVFQRYRLEGAGSMPFVLRRSGGAVALCSLTTTIGYFALVIAQNAALTSFGWMANLGEFGCLTTAICSMPAVLVWLDRRRKTKTAARQPLPGQPAPGS